MQDLLLLLLFFLFVCDSFFLEKRSVSSWSALPTSSWSRGGGWGMGVASDRPVSRLRHRPRGPCPSTWCQSLNTQTCLLSYFIQYRCICYFVWYEWGGQNNANALQYGHQMVICHLITLHSSGFHPFLLLSKLCSLTVIVRYNHCGVLATPSGGPNAQVGNQCLIM